VCSFAALCAFKSRILLRNSIGPVGVGTTTTLLAVRALLKNCHCVHSICRRSPACPPPAWLQTWRAHANLLVPCGPSPTTFNRRSGQLWMPERWKADCGTALWLMLPCGLHTCSCALCFEEKPARTMPFCLFPRSMGSPPEGGVPKRMMPSLLCLLFYDAFSDHACVFLCVSMQLEVELLTRKEIPTQCRIATQEWMTTQYETAA